LDAEVPPDVIGRTPGITSDQTIKPQLSNLKDNQSSRKIDTEYRGPTNETEEVICEIWSDFLGIDDNFFDLGGDSISSMQILNRIRKKFGIGLHHSFLMQAPIISALATDLQTQILQKPDDSEENQTIPRIKR
jgi:acyl carrier protein